MKQISIIFLLTGALLLSACSKEEILQSPSGGTELLCFTGTLSQDSELITRAALPEVLDDTHGTITIHQVGTTPPALATAPYIVKNGYWGTLVPADEQKFLDWSTKVNDLTFHAWTTPKGVTAPTDLSQVTSIGTVNFTTSNIGLEHFIGARAVANYVQSPTVTLPFNHLVAKITIDLRDQYNKTLDAATITFTDVNQEADFFTGNESETDDRKKAPHVTRKAAATAPLTLPYTKGTYLYLPPLAFTEVGAVGDLCISYGGDTYYGTLKGLKTEHKDQNGNITYSDLKELKAGEHLHLKMTLTRGGSVGIGPTILPWQYKDPDFIYGNSAKGIYTEAQLRELAASVNAGTGIPDALNSGTTQAPIVRLYKDITISATAWTAIGNAMYPFVGTFNGNGYTISGLNHTPSGIFGYTDTDAKIQNVILSNCSVTGTGVTEAGLLIGNASNTTIDNCHVIGVSSVTNSNTAGGLIGITAGTTSISNCSIETTGTISIATGGTVGALVGSLTGNTSISNSFAVFTGAADVSLVGGNLTSGSITYSYCWNTSSSNNKGSFWSTSDATQTITFNLDNVFKTYVGDVTTNLLLNALNADTGSGWVYVYGKNYPVLRIEKVPVP